MLKTQKKSAQVCILCGTKGSKENELLKNDDDSFICESCAATYQPN